MNSLVRLLITSLIVVFVTGCGASTDTIKNS